jgi:hypothetical protein
MSPTENASKSEASTYSAGCLAVAASKPALLGFCYCCGTGSGSTCIGSATGSLYSSSSVVESESFFFDFFPFLANAR